VCKLAAVGQMIHKYDEIICSIYQGGHPASHHDPPVGGPWWGSFARTTGVERSVAKYLGGTLNARWAFVLTRGHLALRKAGLLRAKIKIIRNV